MNDRHNRIGTKSQRLTDALGTFNYEEGTQQTPIQRMIEEAVTSGRGFKPEENHTGAYLSERQALDNQLEAMDVRDGKRSSFRGQIDRSNLLGNYLL